MKKITFLIIVVLFSINMMAQTPNAFKYQAVARTSADVVMNNQDISVRISILESDSAIYTEEHAVSTNGMGLFTLNIGEGIPSLGNFQTIDWSTGTYSVEVALDENAGSNYTVMGTSLLLTVPYAMHAKTAENTFSGNFQDLTNTPDMSNYDTDVTDDFSGDYADLTGVPAIPVNTSELNNDSGFITNADDDDADPSNELQDLSLSGTTLNIENGNSVDLSSIDTNSQLSEAQVDEFVNDNGYITNADDDDADPSNELQDLSLSGTTLNIENGNSVDLSSIDTNSQLSEAQVDAFVNNNGYITNADDDDADPNNEIQNLSQVLSINNQANNQIKLLSNPTEAQDAATKSYVDQMLQIMENNGLTIVDFSCDSDTVAEGADINFVDNSAINPTSWLWNFGDGQISTVQNPTHAYSTTGLYTVSLTASNINLSKTETKTNYITVSNDGPGEGLTDIDGNIYSSVLIGEQEWMAENLNVTHYPNGNAIPVIIDNTDWVNLIDDDISDAMCYYNNNLSGEADTYGALYSFAAAIGDNWQRDLVENQGVCPNGWHIPTDDEWIELRTYLGTNGGSKIASNASLWTDGNMKSSVDFGSTGFNGIPGGKRRYNDGVYDTQSEYAYWWSATERDSEAVKGHYIHYATPTFGNFNYPKSSAFSIRCIKN